MDYSVLWDARIAVDLILGGIGIGIFLVAAIGTARKGVDAIKTLRVCAVASLTFVAVGALCLVSELGRPLHVLSTITGFNVTSVTSWGSVLQMAFLLVAFALCLMLFVKKGQAAHGLVFKVVGGVGIVLAAFLLVYHGLVLNSVGRGLWADALITPLFMTSSVLAGGATALVIDTFASNCLGRAGFVLVAVAALAEITLMLAFGFTVAPAGADAAFCYAAMMEQSGALWWFVGFAIGAVAPLVLALVALVKPAMGTPPLVIATALCALAGSFALKFIIASTAQIVIG